MDPAAACRNRRGSALPALGGIDMPRTRTRAGSLPDITWLPGGLGRLGGTSTGGTSGNLCAVDSSCTEPGGSPVAALAPLEEASQTAKGKALAREGAVASERESSSDGGQPSRTGPRLRWNPDDPDEL